MREEMREARKSEIVALSLFLASRVSSLACAPPTRALLLQLHPYIFLCSVTPFDLLNYCAFSCLQQAKAVGNGGLNEILEATLDYNQKPTASSKM